MGYAIQWVRSVIFAFQMYLVMTLIAIVYVPLSALNRRFATDAVHIWCRYVRWSASWIINLKSEVRGTVPEGDIIVAAKHQSFFDIIILTSVLPRPKFIMKKQILWTPIVGYIARRLDCVPVDRGKRGAAIKGMVDAVKASPRALGQLIIFPQGTRVDPGRVVEYKVGVGVLYGELDVPVVPVACNVGVFWPRRRIYRPQGLAVVEFRPVIQPGLSLREVMEQLETEIEGNSVRLMQEAGFTAPAPRAAE